MATYTFIMDYLGGTYVRQIKASNPRGAMKKGVEAMEPAVVTGLGQKLKELLIHDLSWQDEPTPIEGMTNVWASHASARGKFATLTLVQTEVTKAGVK